MILALAGMLAANMMSRQGWKKCLYGIAITAMVVLDLLALLFCLTHISSDGHTGSIFG